MALDGGFLLYFNWPIIGHSARNVMSYYDKGIFTACPPLVPFHLTEAAGKAVRRARLRLARQGGGVLRATTRTQIGARLTFRVHAHTARLCVFIHLTSVESLFSGSLPRGCVARRLTKLTDEEKRANGMTGKAAVVCTQVVVGPGRYCSPCRRMPFYSSHEGFKCVG